MQLADQRKNLDDPIAQLWIRAPLKLPFRRRDYGRKDAALCWYVAFNHHLSCQQAVTGDPASLLL